MQEIRGSDAPPLPRFVRIPELMWNWKARGQQAAAPPRRRRWPAARVQCGFQGSLNTQPAIRATNGEVPGRTDGRVEPPEQTVDRTRPGQPLPEHPDRLRVRHPVAQPKTEKSHERQPVVDQELRLVVAETVLRLDHQDFERLCCKPDVGVSQIRTTTVLSSCFCVGQTVL